MRVISFEHFKQHCKHHDRDSDFNKDSCHHQGHDKRAVFAIVPKGNSDAGKKYYHHPCCEKHCPVLSNCKQASRRTND